jgi:very-short-patch-repair endonuclease
MAKVRRQRDPALWEKLKPLAQQMRHDPTPAEDRLWQALRNRRMSGIRFRRQHAFGKFIVDFYCPEHASVIEIDGEIHDYTQMEDAIRQEYLESLEVRVLRFTNAQVIAALDAVLLAIQEAIALTNS